MRNKFIHDIIFNKFSIFFSTTVFIPIFVILTLNNISIAEFYTTTGKIVEINIETKTLTVIYERINKTVIINFDDDTIVEVGKEKKTIADIKVGHKVKVVWNFPGKRGVARSISREPTSEEQKVIEARKEARKRLEAEQRKIAEEKKRKAEEEKRKEINKRYNEFIKNNGVEEWPDISELYANPFVSEGKIVALRARFETMQTATQGIFGVGINNKPVIVSDIPKGMFKEEGLIVVLASKVIGKTETKLPLVGTMQVPHLKFVGIHFCQDDHCYDIIPDEASLEKATHDSENRKTHSEELEKKSTLYDCEKAKEYYKQANSINEAIGDIEKKISLCKKAIELCPDFPDAHDALGSTYKHKGMYDDAEREYKEALRIDPNDYKSHINLGFFLMEQGKYNDAILEFDEGLRINPNNAVLRYYIGKSYSDHGMYNDAVREYKEALKIRPNYEIAQRALEEIKINNNTIQPSETKKQEITSLQEEGSNAIKSQNWNAAVKAYKKLLEIAPENYDANTNIGTAYTMLNEFDLSITHLTKAQQLKPAEYQPYYLKGVSYARKGDKDRAIESLQDAIYKGYKDLSVSDLEKDTNLPEDFKQDQRFKGLLGKLAINKSISGVQDANLFDMHKLEFPHKYDEVWNAVDYILKDQKEKIIQSDKETGVIITDTCSWSMSREYYKYYIFAERMDDTSTKLQLRLVAHDSIFDKELKRSVLKPMHKPNVNKKATKFLESVKKRLEKK